MSAESHLFSQITRDLPIYFTFQMNCSLFCHSAILFCNLFCGPWQVENEPWFSPLSCMLIARPIVQLFACRTEGPDPIFGEGRKPGCVIPQLLLLIQLWQEGNSFSLPLLPCLSGQRQRTNYPVQLATEICCGSSEVCSVPYGVWPWVWMCGWSPESKSS